MVGWSLCFLFFLSITLSLFFLERNIWRLMAGNGHGTYWFIFVHLIGKRDFLCLKGAHIHNKMGQDHHRFRCFVVCLSVGCESRWGFIENQQNKAYKALKVFQWLRQFYLSSVCTSVCVWVPERCEEKARLCWLESNFEHISLFSNVWTRWPWDGAHPRGMIVWASRCCVFTEWHKPHHTFPSGQSLQLSVS